MSYQVKPCGLEVRHRRSLVIELLDVVFTELAQSKPVGLPNGCRGKHFGHRQERNLRRVAMGPFGRSGNALVDRRKARRQAFERWLHAPSMAHASEVKFTLDAPELNRTVT